MAVCCQNLPLGALSNRSAHSMLLASYLKSSLFFFEHAEIQENAIKELRAVTESAFQEAFQQWKKRWEQCIASSGDYFEGNSA
jgi:hypothetical protein